MGLSLLENLKKNIPQLACYAMVCSFGAKTNPANKQQCSVSAGAVQRIVKKCVLARPVDCTQYLNAGALNFKGLFSGSDQIFLFSVDCFIFSNAPVWLFKWTLQKLPVLSEQKMNGLLSSAK